MILFSFIFDDTREKNQSPLVDEELIVKIAQGDMGSFDDFYNKTERAFYAYLLSLTKDHDMTLDLMQESYIKLISAAHLYKPMGKPLAWLFTIGRNLFYSQIKRRKREVNIDLIQTLEDDSFNFIEDLEDRIVLEGVLNLLTEEEREIVMLYAVSGLKHKEIAKHMNLKLSTELSKYHRAIKKLIIYLEERGVRP